MAKRYYTLCLLYKGADTWSIHFGDYDKQTVIDERLDVLDGYDADNIAAFKVISTKDDQPSINAAVAKLNSLLKKVDHA
jgi:hypothetical protein